MWTHENRPKYNRDHLRYPSDLTDDEWAYVEPLIPPAKPGGGKRRTDMRAVMNGVMYILSTGCQWRYLPKDFPPRSTVHNYFVWWQCDRVLDRIHHALYVECRDKAEREASPTAAIIDSQSVKSAEKDAMGRAARTMAPSSLQRINGAPHAKAERFEQIPRNSRTRCNAHRRDRDGPVELAGRRYCAWRRALTVEEARGR
jgi:transposase